MLSDSFQISRRQHSLIWLVACALLTTSCSRRIAPVGGEPSFQTSEKTRAALFQVADPRELRLEISDSSIDKIKLEHRPYVRADLVESDSLRIDNVGVKIKGAAGSTRDFEDKPGLTIKVDKFSKGQSFHGLEKFHLNNAVQDATYMHEWLGAKIFHDAAYPAPRITHARLHLNNRDVGLYVLKEGFDLPFLLGRFSNPDGNLYDGGFCQDIDAELEKDAGNGPNDRSDLQAVVEACRESDPATRWKRMEEVIDIDRFLSFMALERMLAHWDGYSVGCNNYRLYFDPKNRKAVFLPHGMDQVFGDTGMSLFGHQPPMVAIAIMQNNAWRIRYRERVRSFVPLFHPDRLITALERVATRVTSKLETMSEEWATEHRDNLQDLQNRIRERYQNLLEQLEQPDAVPIPFGEDSFVLLEDWYQNSEVENAILPDPGEAPEAMLQIKSGEDEYCVASWRRTVLLGPGRYRFHATLSCYDVVTHEEGPNLVGANVRVSGSEPTDPLVGTHEKLSRETEFEVLEDQREVELVIELRCKSGRLAAAKDSLRLQSLGPSR